MQTITTETTTETTATTEEVTQTITEEWPSCICCGREYAAWDEEGTVPDTSCWYCDKHQN